MNIKITILYAFNAKPIAAYILTGDFCPEDFQFLGYNHLLQLSNAL